MTLFGSIRARLESDSLASRVFRGSAWTLSSRLLVQLLGLARLIVLANLLSPADFGLFGIALLLMSLVEVATEGGLSLALVQRRAASHVHLDTVFVTQIVRGLVTAAILYLAAPNIAAFFESSPATEVIRVVALVVVARCLVNPAMILFNRSIDFRRVSLIPILEATVGLGAGIPAAYYFRDVRALLISFVAAQLAATIASWLFATYRPRLRFSRGAFVDLLSFGKWAGAANLLHFVLANIDDVLVGKVLGSTPLGLYQTAFRISNLPATQITHTISSVTLPAYSSIQDDEEQVTQLFLKVLSVTASISLPVGVALIVSAHDAFEILLGPQWGSAISTFQILCAFGIVRSLTATFGPVFQAVNRPDIVTKLSFLQLVILGGVLLPLMSSYGLVGAGLGVSLANAGALLVLSTLWVHHFASSARELLKAVLPGAGLALAYSLLAMVVKSTVQLVPWMRLAIDVVLLVLCVVCFAALFWAFRTRRGSQVGRDLASVTEKGAKGLLGTDSQ